MTGSLFSSGTRTGRFLRTLSSSYVLLLAATAYSLGVVPLILTYTNALSLGLWSLVVQFGTYLTLLDAGLSGACIRQFVGPLVRQDEEQLASQFQNAMVLAGFQGLLIGLAGCAGGLLVPWLSIPAEQARLFASLFLAQCCLVALEFPFRPFNSLLLAQQRFEFHYLTTAVGMMLSLGLVWLGMAHGMGLWSLVGAGAFQALVKTVTSMVCVARFYGLRKVFSGFRLQRRAMRQLLTEGSSFFSGTLFGTVGGMAQATLLSRWLGLEGVAAWSVGSKAANLLSQLLSKFYESSFAGLSELFESGRTDLLLRRLGQLFGWVMGLALFSALGLCLMNGEFVQLWTGARVPWPSACDAAVALWLVGLTASRGLAEQTKILLRWRWIRWGPALECLLWLGMTPWLASRFALWGFVTGTALAPLLASGIVYLGGLRGLFLGAKASLIPRDSLRLVVVGSLLFLLSLPLAVFRQETWIHMLWLFVCAFIFLWLLLPNIQALRKSIRQTAETLS